MENNKTAEQFCKIHTEYHGEVIDSVKQIFQQTFRGKELMEFCEFYSTQQSKEKDERIKELEFANEEVRKKHDLARNVITDQNEEIKRLREVETKWISAEQKPESEKAVLAVIKGCKIPVRVMWVEEFSLSTEDWSFDGDEDYDEATDKYYWPEGWYEWNEMEEVHWMQKDVLFWAEMPQIPIDLNQ